MLKLKRTLIGMLALTMLAMLVAPYRAAAQTGTKTYEVTVTNITNSMQGLSPLVIATHPASAHAWQMGQMASPGLEKVAEDGMPDLLASELKGVATDVQTTKAHLLPGDSIKVRITAKDGDMISAATMLIQTNDGFTGLDSVALVDGDTDTMAYDAGTENNTEAKSDVPGPPLGGKSDAPDTQPHQPIAAHPGIEGKADVPPEFKWTGPVARFSIRAINAAPPTGPTYDVTVTNITNSMQGLSPLVIATHPASAHAWQMGQMASKGLEVVAEDGMPGLLASELKAVATDVVTTGAHLFPGDSITVRITAKQGDMISAATMLIQTNDGFTGLDAAALVDGDTDTMAYDAGTENNTEAKSDVPGPPLGGKSDAPDTQPHQPIAAHPGIEGKADVPPEFKWTGPVARFSIRTVAGSVAQPTSVPATSVPATSVPPVSAQPTSVPAATSVPATPVTPTMPKTGAADIAIWLIAAIAAIVALFGFVLRRTTVTRRQ